MKSRVTWTGEKAFWGQTEDGFSVVLGTSTNTFNDTTILQILEAYHNSRFHLILHLTLRLCKFELASERERQFRRGGGLTSIEPSMTDKETSSRLEPLTPEQF
jgi:hypothetical protein